LESSALLCRVYLSCLFYIVSVSVCLVSYISSCCNPCVYIVVRLPTNYLYTPPAGQQDDSVVSDSCGCGEERTGATHTTHTTRTGPTRETPGWRRGLPGRGGGRGDGLYSGILSQYIPPLALEVHQGTCPAYPQHILPLQASAEEKRESIDMKGRQQAVDNGEPSERRETGRMLAANVWEPRIPSYTQVMRQYAPLPPRSRPTHPPVSTPSSPFVSSSIRLLVCLPNSQKKKPSNQMIGTPGRWWRLYPSMLRWCSAGVCLGYMAS
jgi:hypothetical protein